MNKSRLAELIASRICHDIISPLGAVGNGVELLSMIIPTSSEELDLVSQSAASAAAKAQMFRIAFGPASDDLSVAKADLSNLLGSYFLDGRIVCDCHFEGSLSRSEAKALLLAALCFESSLPTGGRITIQRLDSKWSLEAQIDGQIDVTPWALVQDPALDLELRPALVHFYLLPLALSSLARKAVVIQESRHLKLEF